MTHILGYLYLLYAILFHSLFFIMLCGYAKGRGTALVACYGFLLATSLFTPAYWIHSAPLSFAGHRIFMQAWEGSNMDFSHILFIRLIVAGFMIPLLYTFACAAFEGRSPNMTDMRTANEK